MIRSVCARVLGYIMSAREQTVMPLFCVSNIHFVSQTAFAIPPVPPFASYDHHLQSHHPCEKWTSKTPLQRAHLKPAVGKRGDRCFLSLSPAFNGSPESDFRGLTLKLPEISVGGTSGAWGSQLMDSMAWVRTRTERRQGCGIGRANNRRSGPNRLIW